MIKVMGQPWCGESVRIVKLSHLGLVEVPHNPVHVILREEFSFPPKYQQDLVLHCYLSRPCVAWGGPASCWTSLNISLWSGFWTLTWYEGCSWLCWGGPRQGGPLERDSLRRCCPALSSAFRLSSSSASPWDFHMATLNLFDFRVFNFLGDFAGCKKRSHQQH